MGMTNNSQHQAHKETSPQKCQITEIVQYSCDLQAGKTGTSGIQCFPIPRIFRMYMHLFMFLEVKRLSLTLQQMSWKTSSGNYEACGYRPRDGRGRTTSRPPVRVDFALYPMLFAFPPSYGIAHERLNFRSQPLTRRRLWRDVIRYDQNISDN